MFVIVTKKVDKESPKKKPCITCSKEKYIDRDFYVSYSPLNADGRISVCKVCLGNMFDINNPHESINNIMRQIDKPYVSHLVQTSIEESPTNILGKYMKNIGMRQYQDMTWSDSVSPEVKKDESMRYDQSSSINTNELNELKKKYGFGYPDEEYFLFDEKYQQLKTSFQLLTTMHEEYFREFCVNKVKETLAKARGDFKEAKEWAAMVKDVAEAGKLKPSQMSKSDLSGGLDTFGQLVRMVEENYEIMPVLPMFTQQPKDKVDVTLWCYINYVRDLKGLPECEYREIYDFYERKREDYEKQTMDNQTKEVDVDG